MSETSEARGSLSANHKQGASIMHEASEGSGSSIAELSALDEYQLRSSFRSIRIDMTSPGPFIYSGNRDVNRGTPDSTASSSKRFFTNSHNGEKKEFSTNGLQESLTNQNNDRTLAKSTRELIESAHSMSYEQPPETFINKQDFPSRSKLVEEDARSIKRDRCFPKLLLFAAVLIIVVAGLVVVVVTQKDKEPDAQTGSIIADEPEGDGESIAKACPDVEVSLRQRITLVCSADRSARTAITLLLVPPPYANKGENVSTPLNSDTDSEWSSSLDIAGRLDVSGPEATCGSPGTYRLILLDQSNASVYMADVILRVKSEILQVNVTLNQSISDSSRDFTVGCSTKSGCEKSFVDFFAEINQEENILRGVNFTCTITYNDYDGYSVSCVGTIPDFLMSQFGSITCRPSSDLLANLTDEAIKELEQVLELPECDISKHCGYKCLEMGDYFVVNSGRCDIFHRCYAGRVYTEYCAPGTFFDPTECACRHTTDLQWCQENGALKKNLYQDIPKKVCNIETPLFYF